MRKLFITCKGTFLLCLLLVFFTGCFKDKCTMSYTVFQPVYKTPAEVRANIKSNPPKEIQQPGKLFLKGNFLFINEIDRGIHVVDNSNPASPVNIAFIDIPGNMDLAVKGNSLYADSYTDLVVIDISDPRNIVAKKFVDGVFPNRAYTGFAPDQSKVIVDWIKQPQKMTVDCANSTQNIYPAGGGTFYTLAADAQAPFSTASASASSPFGIGGSMSRFAIVNNFLYAVDYSDLYAYDITNAWAPSSTGHFTVDWHVETVYPFKDKLFVGSNNGMYMYDVNADPARPSLLGQFTHARSCDPVIADDTTAYVTLSDGSPCLGFADELDIVDINNLASPTLLKTYPLTHPLGLSKDGNLLFICDEKDGLKVFDASDLNNLNQIKRFTETVTYDVIAFNGIAYVVGNDGLYEYDYSNRDNIHLVSKISITKQSL